MKIDELVVRAAPGEGLVARFQGVALVVVPDSARHEAMVGQLLAMGQGAAAFGDAPGRRLARHIAGLLSTAEPDDVPAFGLVAQADTGLVLILHGCMDAYVSWPQGQEHLSGSQVATWVDRILPPPIVSLIVTPSGRPAANPDPRTGLVAGVVSGAGLSLAPAHQLPAAVPPPPEPQVLDWTPTAVVEEAPPPAVVAAPSPPPVVAPVVVPPPPVVAPVVIPPPAVPAVPERAGGWPPPDPGSQVAPPDLEDPTVLARAASPPPVEPEAGPRPFIAVALSDPPTEPEEARAPLPIAGELAPGHEEPAGPRVRGVICSRGHFNDPSAPFCGACGISMVQRTLNLVEGPRPPLGVIVFDDGTTFTLDCDYVLGREPENDPTVLSGDARPLALEDPNRTVSRVHAGLVIDGWNVQAVDRGSANGTFIAGPNEDNWVPLSPNRPTPIKPGTRVRLGQRVLLYDSHQGTR